ncbi:MAG TPA: IPT/TIG domain-containing protein [Bryobacteraceae bacterium]|jgi:uncharacterized protein (TIGR03437 family)|nr:IPT/TIG domain-containing protein [Bryobacteraceae bacterium]
MAAVVLLAALVLVQSSGSGPYYTADSIANSAANVTGLYAPNTFVTIYGQNLAYTTRALAVSDIAGGMLPTVLGTTGVRVLINNIPANIYYVSPTQVNLLIPTSLVPGPVMLQLVVDSLAGPAIPIMLQSAAPSLFQLDATTVLAVHLNGSTITSASPAQAGEVVVLFASGLGPTNPAAIPNQIPQQAASVSPMSSFAMLINGAAVNPQQILYAGVVPTFAGLFQINVQLPNDTPSNPQIQIGYSGIMSPPGRMLPVQ